jgi:hypothetical protein
MKLWREPQYPWKNGEEEESAISYGINGDSGRLFLLSAGDMLNEKSIVSVK